MGYKEIRVIFFLTLKFSTAMLSKSPLLMVTWDDGTSVSSLNKKAAVDQNAKKEKRKGIKVKKRRKK